MLTSLDLSCPAGHSSANVAEAVRYSEHSRTKCIGLTIETRPDYCLGPHLRDMLSYGCTRLEMGVQSVYEDVARDTNRGHTVEAVKECFCLAKDAGFKVNVQQCAADAAVTSFFHLHCVCLLHITHMTCLMAMQLLLTPHPALHVLQRYRLCVT